MWLWRPIVAERQMYSQADLEGTNAWVTLEHVMNAHEALDLIAAIQERATRE